MRRGVSPRLSYVIYKMAMAFFACLVTVRWSFCSRDVLMANIASVQPCLVMSSNTGLRTPVTSRWDPRHPNHSGEFYTIRRWLLNIVPGDRISTMGLTAALDVLQANRMPTTARIVLPLFIGLCQTSTSRYCITPRHGGNCGTSCITSASLVKASCWLVGPDFSRA